jgi:hypothetical protein
MVTSKHALRLVARHMNAREELKDCVDGDTWLEVAPLLRSMQIANQETKDVYPLRGGCHIYYIRHCCSLKNLDLFEHCPSLHLDGGQFCEECWTRVFDELENWYNLKSIKLNTAAYLGSAVVDRIWAMWQSHYQLVEISLGEIHMQEEDEALLVAHCGNLTKHYLYNRMARDWQH